MARRPHADRSVALIGLSRRPNVDSWGAVFTSPTGLLRDPSNTQAGLRDVFRRIGYPW